MKREEKELHLLMGRESSLKKYCKIKGIYIKLIKKRSKLQVSAVVPRIGGVCKCSPCGSCFVSHIKRSLGLG
jgi:hypothetical protein